MEKEAAPTSPKSDGNYTSSTSSSSSVLIHLLTGDPGTTQQEDNAPKEPGCGHCATPFADMEEEPVLCQECHAIEYCSEECHNKDKRVHSVICHLILDDKQVIHQLSETFLLDMADEEEVYRLVIDAYRLRSDDYYRSKRFRAKRSLYSLYSYFDKGMALNGFRKFLRQMQNSVHPDTLPSWWSEDNVKKCREYAQERTRDKSWGNLGYPIDNHDIIVYYASSSMPLQLRLLADSFLGKAQVTPEFKTFWTAETAKENDALTKNEAPAAHESIFGDGPTRPSE